MGLPAAQPESSTQSQSEVASRDAVALHVLNLPTILVLLWAAGALVLIARKLVGTMRALRLRGAAEPDFSSVEAELDEFRRHLEVLAERNAEAAEP